VIGCDNTRLDDAGLLDRYLYDGDESAMSTLIARHSRDLYRFAASRVGASDAPDIVQDTWEAVLTTNRLTSGGNFRAFVFQIAHNRILRFMQERSRWTAARGAFEWAGGRLQSGACAYCDRPAFRGDLCAAHARRRAKGATEEEMRRPIRQWTRKEANE
jgi:DNA-directed RNA polymerase specialized sigma24 family protein